MLIGREAETKKLKDAYMSASPEFVAVYGRRRVGKTYLIRETFGGEFAFYHTGIANVGRHEQLDRFARSLERYGAKHGKKPLRNWFEAFDRLEDYLQGYPAGKKVIFIDELPWMDTAHSGFTSALESFWNGWASARNDIMLIICGSATSWMTSKILNSRGGLHNRLTYRIRLEPFSLAECERFLTARGIVATRRQVLEYYMVMGGVPYYWNYIAKDKSPAQNIDAMFFAPDAELREEYGHLYASLFRKPQQHIAIVTALGTKKVGMTREELLKATRLPDNGMFSQSLRELVECGFIRKYRVAGKKSHEAIFQLMDNFTLFHFRFLAEQDEGESISWSAMQNTSKVNAWRGLSFERVCLEHISQIKRALGISGVSTRQYAWRSRPGETKNGAQIDLLIERADNVVNICEMKYASGQYVITKDEHAKMLHRRDAFLTETGCRKAAYITLITTDGTAHNVYWNDIQADLALDALFL
ncbi:MAG: ATP-binding protein [Victivallales bacterium]|nr:ATP-binding protein [Victivallales bacterium]